MCTNWHLTYTQRELSWWHSLSFTFNRTQNARGQFLLVWMMTDWQSLSVWWVWVNAGNGSLCFKSANVNLAEALYGCSCMCVRERLDRCYFTFLIAVWFVWVPPQQFVSHLSPKLTGLSTVFLPFPHLTSSLSTILGFSLSYGEWMWWIRTSNCHLGRFYFRIPYVTNCL